MSRVFAETLYSSGRSHLLSAALLYEAAIQFAEENDIAEPAHYAFNGTHSLSIFYLTGLGFELCLKAAYILYGGDANEKHLKKEIGHDVLLALDWAGKVGFVSAAPNLREIVEYLREPLLDHSFRYKRPASMALPDPMEMFAAAEVLDNELRPLVWPEEKQG